MCKKGYFCEDLFVRNVIMLLERKGNLLYNKTRV